MTTGGSIGPYQGALIRPVLLVTVLIMGAFLCFSLGSRLGPLSFGTGLQIVRQKNQPWVCDSRYIAHGFPLN